MRQKIVKNNYYYFGDNMKRGSLSDFVENTITTNR